MSSYRKLLIQDLNDLKYQQEEFKKALSGPVTEGEQGKKEDSVILRIALRYYCIVDECSINDFSFSSRSFQEAVTPRFRSSSLWGEIILSCTSHLRATAELRSF